MKEIFHLFVESLSEKEMEWMAWGVAEIILADGRILDPEVYFLKVMLYNVAEKEKVLDISEYVKEKKEKAATTFLNINDEMAIEMLQFFVKIAASDGCISPEEEKVILYLGKRIGFDQTTCTEIIQIQKKTLSWKKYAEKHRLPQVPASVSMAGIKLN